MIEKQDRASKTAVFQDGRRRPEIVKFTMNDCSRRELLSHSRHLSSPTKYSLENSAVAVSVCGASSELPRIKLR